MNFRRGATRIAADQSKYAIRWTPAIQIKTPAGAFMEIGVLERSSVAAGFYPRFISAALPAIS